MTIQLDEITSSEIATKLWADIDDAKNYYEDQIESKIIDRYDQYYANPDYYQKKLPKLSRTSSLVATDCLDTIEWALPSIVKIFYGSDDIICVKGVNAEDEEKATVMQELIKFQLTRKNPSFVVLYNWFKDSLICGLGIIKCWWEREVREDTQTDLLGAEALQAMQMQPGVQIVSTEQVSVDLYKVTYVITSVLKNQPKIENIMASELLFSPRARNLDEAPFVAHRKRVTIDYLRRKELDGIYTNIDEVLQNEQTPPDSMLETHLFDDVMRSNSPSVDEARREVELFECYTKLDINDDGLLEDLIITIVGQTIIRIEENGFGRHPFFVLSPSKDPHRIYPRKSYIEIIAQLQDLKTAMMRQIVMSTALSNEGRIILSEEAINIEDFISGRSVIRKKAGYAMNDAVQPVPMTPLAPWTFSFLQWIEDRKQDSTGVTKYTQGMDSRSLNKTATGISAIMTASNQRLEMICRMFAETGISELYRYLIALNQKFMDQATSIRVAGKPFQITPDDLDGDFDLEISAGVGMGTKEMTIQNLTVLLTTITQIMQMGIPIAQPENIYHILKRYIEELGFKNISDFLTDPAIIQQQMAMQQAQQQQAMAAIQQQQAEQQMAPSESISYKDLPIAGKIQLAARAGIHLSPEDFAAEALNGAIGTATTTTNSFVRGTPRGTGNGGPGIPPGLLSQIQGMGANQAKKGVHGGGIAINQAYAPRSR